MVIDFWSIFHKVAYIDYIGHDSARLCNFVNEEMMSYNGEAMSTAVT